MQLIDRPLEPAGTGIEATATPVGIGNHRMPLTTV